MHTIAPASRLIDLAAKFRFAVRDGGIDRDQLGAKLYSELFSKLSPAVRNRPSWLISSGDALFDVPFAALVAGSIDGRPVYLVDRHQTSRIPSALAIMRPEPPRRPIIDGPFLGIGDGVYNTADPRLAASRQDAAMLGLMYWGSRSSKPQMELPRLVSSAYELQQSAAAWNPHERPILLTGTNASRENLVTALRVNPAILHIAAHIIAPAGRPDQAMIHLGLRPDGNIDVLTTNDVAGIVADGALVVLSGCSSAAGNSVRGAGVTGLTRAFLLAGARGVVGSRWPVADDSGELFRSFYAHLAETGLSRSGLNSAMHQARLEMLRSKTWRSDPRYWAAFYLFTRN